MALHLKTLAQRSLSAVVFVALLLGSVLLGYISFVLFFGTVAIIGLHEFYNIAQKLGYKPYRITGFVCAIIIYAVFIKGFLITENALLNGLIYLKPLIAILPIVVLCVALFSNTPLPIHNAAFTLAGILYVILPFVLLQDLVVGEKEARFYYKPNVLLGIIFLIWSNDTFAYLGGSLFGKHKMIERISPGKTWEGTLFGVVVTFGVSFLIRSYLDEKQADYWLLFGAVVPILATIGDLVESMLKRQAGLKDSGNIMPGHGGVLDRFDSLLFVLPVVTVFFYFL